MKGQVLALLGLALLLAACGGSGGGGSNNGNGGGGSNNGNGGGGGSTPSSITLTVEDPRGSFSAAAYQVGATGSWTAINNWNTSGNTKTFTFPLNGETKYGVAVRCGNKIEVLQATSGELANPKVECSRTNPGTVSFTVEVGITGIQVANGDKVCVNDQWCSPPLAQGATSATVQVSNAPAVSGGRDLLITLREQDTSTGLEWVKVAKVERNKQPQNGDIIQVELKDSDRRNPSASLTIPLSAPSGYMYFPAALISYGSANGTASGLVNASFTQYRPVSGFGGRDLYAAFILASRSNAELMSIKLFSSGAPSLEFAAPWDDNGLTVNKKSHPTVGNLNRNENDLKGYAIFLLSGQLYYNAFLSKGWLGGDTSYQLPDLSDANLLNYTAPRNGDSVSISVTAAWSSITVLTTDPLGDLTNPSIFRAGDGDHFKIATAQTSFTVDENDSNPISFP